MHTHTFKPIYSRLAVEPLVGILSFLVAYGHLLIGLALIFGLLTRFASAIGIVLMVLYWSAHMNWPYISDNNNFILDSHIVYAAVLILLIQVNAGQIFGLDGLLFGKKTAISQ